MLEYEIWNFFVTIFENLKFIDSVIHHENICLKSAFDGFFLSFYVFVFLFKLCLFSFWYLLLVSN